MIYLYNEILLTYEKRIKTCLAVCYNLMELEEMKINQMTQKKKDKTKYLTHFAEHKSKVSALTIPDNNRDNVKEL